jgi:hypothetical protein
VDAAGDGIGLHRVHEAHADLRSELGGDHHPVEHFARLRDLRDGWRALRIRCDQPREFLRERAHSVERQAR